MPEGRRRRDKIAISEDTMHICGLSFLCVQFLVILSIDADANKDKKLQIGIKKRVDPEKCKVKSRKGDVLHMHYTVNQF